MRFIGWWFKDNTNETVDHDGDWVVFMSHLSPNSKKKVYELLWVGISRGVYDCKG